LALRGATLRGSGRNCPIRSGMIFTAHHIMFFLVIVSRYMRLTGHVTCNGRGQMLTGFWWVNMNERGHLEVLGVDGRLILEWNLNHCVGCVLD